MKSTTLIAIIVGLIALLAAGVGGFFLGKAGKFSQSEVVVTKPPISETITVTDTLIVYETLPAEVRYIYKTDTLRLISEVEVERVDTVYVVDTLASLLATAEDWNTLRSYAMTLFDNDIHGSLEVEAEVQYNKLQELDYTFTPAPTAVTVSVPKTPEFTPYVRFAAGSTVNSVSIGGGVFVQEHFGVDVSYMTLFNEGKHGVEVGLMWKF